MLASFLALALLSHPGGVDATGCHAAKQTGERHCHEKKAKAPSPAPAKPPPAKATAPDRPSHGARAYVEKATDGDTLRLRIAGKRYDLRVQGIDCPESKMNAKCLRDGEEACKANVPKGIDAGRRTAALVKHRVVKLESTKGEGPLDLDKYKRLLGYVTLADGRDLGLVLVQEGLCFDYGFKYEHPRSAAYLAATPKPAQPAETAPTVPSAAK